MVSDPVGGPTLHAVRRRPTDVVPAAPVRRSTVEPTFRLANSKLRVTASPSDVAATRFLLQSSKKPAQYPSGIRDRLQRKLLRMAHHRVVRLLRRLVLAGPQRATIAYFGLASRSVDSPTRLLLPSS